MPISFDELEYNPMNGQKDLLEPTTTTTRTENFNFPELTHPAALKLKKLFESVFFVLI